MNDNKLFELREYNNYSQREIAEKMEISQQNYSLWEKGNSYIPLRHLNSLCNIYNVSMDYMLGLTNDKIDNSIKQIKVLNQEEIGKRIKEFRTTNKLTLRNLASELNTTFSTISAYESGKTLILTAFAYQICQKYKISLDWLCGRTK